MRSALLLGLGSGLVGATASCRDDPRPAAAETFLLDPKGRVVSVSTDLWAPNGSLWERRSAETGAVLDRYQEAHRGDAEFGLRFTDSAAGGATVTIFLKEAETARGPVAEGVPAVN